MNRPVRTRMPGGVGGVPEQSGPLSRLSLSRLVILEVDAKHLIDLPVKFLLKLPTTSFADQENFALFLHRV